MRTTLSFGRPDELEATMQITMEVKTWRALRDQLKGLPDDWPSYSFVTQVEEVISKAEAVFYSAKEKK